jgi:hypothetical protein
MDTIAAEVAGPGVITGAADDDPSGIATFQMMCARIGKVNGTRLGCEFEAPISEVVATRGRHGPACGQHD